MLGEYRDTSTVITHSKSRAVARQVAVTMARIKACYPVSQLKLETINLGIFSYLYKSGKSKEQICCILELKTAEFRRIEILMAL